jgi:hypothetical protein
MASDHEQTALGADLALLGRREFLARAGIGLLALSLGGYLSHNAAAGEVNNRRRAMELIHGIDQKWTGILGQVSTMAKSKNKNVVTPKQVILAAETNPLQQYIVMDPRASRGLYSSLVLDFPPDELGPNDSVTANTSIISTSISQSLQPERRSPEVFSVGLARFPGTPAETYALVYGNLNVTINVLGQVQSLQSAQKSTTSALATSTTAEQMPLFEEIEDYMVAYMKWAENIVNAADMFR